MEGVDQHDIVVHDNARQRHHAGAHKQHRDVGEGELDTDHHADDREHDRLQGQEDMPEIVELPEQDDGHHEQ